MDKYHVTKEEIDQFEGVSKIHSLNDQARRVNKSLGDLTGLTGFGFHLIEVEPGYDSTELHKHHHEDECVYVLEGEAQATVGESTFVIRPGDFVGYRAGGEPHKLRNVGTSTLRCIVVGQRLDHDVGDYPLKNQRIYRNKGIAWNLVDIDNIKEYDSGEK